MKIYIYLHYYIFLIIFLQKYIKDDCTNFFRNFYNYLKKVMNMSEIAEIAGDVVPILQDVFMLIITLSLAVLVPKIVIREVRRVGRG